MFIYTLLLTCTFTQRACYLRTGRPTLYRETAEINSAIAKHYYTTTCTSWSRGAALSRRNAFLRVLLFAGFLSLFELYMGELHCAFRGVLRRARSFKHLLDRLFCIVSLFAPANGRIVPLFSGEGGQMCSRSHGFLLGVPRFCYVLMGSRWRANSTARESIYATSDANV